MISRRRSSSPTRSCCLTRRPTRVAEIVDVDLPWPRDLDVTTGERFIALKRHCLERFWREVKRD